jgi:hypothetical protein
MVLPKGVLIGNAESTVSKEDIGSPKGKKRREDVTPAVTFYPLLR